MNIGLGIFGANGRMGRVLIEACDMDPELKLAGASVRENSPWMGMDVGEIAGIGKRNLTVQSDLNSYKNDIDVVVDFTLPTVIEANLQWCVDNQKPIVIGTTGLNEQQLALMTEAANYIPIVFAANYSVGVNLMLNLVRQTAAVMGKTADIEIVETHHRYKKDAPSGTAMAIGNVIADELGRDLSDCAVYGREGETGERDQQTIGFATIRAGDVIGDHTALFADIGERLEITHKASSRLTFAKGAMTAAKWLIGRPSGLYSMEHVLGFK